jgi:hypothetical protein
MTGSGGFATSANDDADVRQADIDAGANQRIGIAAG